MSNVLSETKKQQILALGRLNWSLRRIEAETGVRRETASAYLREAGIPIRRPGRWGHPARPAIEVLTDSAASPGSKPAKEAPTDSEVAPGSKPAKEVPTDSSATGPPQRSRAPQASACEPHREFIEQSLRRGRNAMAIWQDLVDHHGFEAKYWSVRRFVSKLRGSSAPEAHPFIVTTPGEEAQVDYGEGPMVRHPDTGKYRRTRLFVLTLGYSRKSVRLLVWKSGSREWCQLHEQAFRRLGGAVRVVVLDNLKEGVLKADIYDPALNPLYKDMLEHYGAVALTCRVGHPDRKGKVESAVGHAQRTPLKGLRFESLEDAQKHLDHWEQRWADTRIHGTTKRQVAAMFSEERPALTPLPPTPFGYYQFGKRTVHINGCVEVDGAYYGPPPGHIGRLLEVQWDDVHVRIIEPNTGELLRELDKQPAGRVRIRPEDKPKRAPPSTLKLLKRAERGGGHTGKVCHRIYETEGTPLGINRILGVLKLAKKHGTEAVERTCSVALEVEAPTYRFVKRYIEKLPPKPPTLRQVDPLIRQLELYRDLIDRQPQGEIDEHD